ncbi:MAG: PH domain-containing protein [Chloroflexi bacterium]|nr:PH domain-containing protein [Chloroflexota bacterium]MBA3740101.1 PH domain-containing protein [Chloroflexota bacterium]
MSYARNLLSRNEEVVYESRQHWFAIIARTWVWLLVAIVALALVIFLSGSEVVVNETVDGVLTIIAVAGLLGAIGYVGFVLWDWRNQEWLITTRRVIRAEGVLNKSVSDSSLEKINDARLDQSVFGRIFGFGTLDILTAAEEAGGTNTADFPMIADPVRFKKAMFDQKQMLEQPELAQPRYQRAGPPPDMQRAEPMPPRAGSDRVAIHGDDVPDAPRAAAPPPAAPERNAADDLGSTLERLTGLREKGLITPEEYEAKKRDLLERM